MRTSNVHQITQTNSSLDFAIHTSQTDFTSVMKMFTGANFPEVFDQQMHSIICEHRCIDLKPFGLCVFKRVPK